MNTFVWNFNIRLLGKNTKDSFFSTEGTPVFDIMSDRTLFNPNAPVILADPFLFLKDEELYLFYERQEKWFGGKGCICMRKTRDLSDWSDEVIVLSEPFHLSFPWVFEHEGKVYMLPETGHDHSIRLYEAEDNTLVHWKLVKKLMEDELPWTDSTIFKKDGVYYLFTSHDVASKQEQHLFVAYNLFGPYHEHPSSPIYIGRDGGRNAGSIIEYNGELYRPVQMCTNSYGEQTSIMKISVLSPLVYEESSFKNNIIDQSKGFYKWGGHQFNAVYFKEKWIVATDSRTKNYNIIELMRKIWRHVR